MSFISEEQNSVTKNTQTIINFWNLMHVFHSVFVCMTSPVQWNLLYIFMIAVMYTSCLNYSASQQRELLRIIHINYGCDGLQKSGVFSDCPGGHNLILHVVKNG